MNLAPGGTQQFTAAGHDASGNAVAITPAWSATAGTINATGFFTAPVTSGPVTVTATSGGISGTAAATVNAGALSSITVSPGQVTLTNGRSQQFTAAGRDANGNVVAIMPIWSATAGTINATGFFTAPAASGTITVTATSGSVSGNATVYAVPDASITGFTLYSTGTRSSWINASINITNHDTVPHWFVIDVSGVNSVDGYPLVSTATVLLNAGGTLDSIPVLVTIPPAATTGNYNLIAGIWRIEDFASPVKLINSTGTRTVNIN